MGTRKWYYFSPEKTDKLEKGQMATGWLSLSPKEMVGVMMWMLVKNDNKNSLSKMMEISKKSTDTKVRLYCSPNGELVYNTKKIIDGKEYDFDKFGICLNPLFFIFSFTI